MGFFHALKEIYGHRAPGGSTENGIRDHAIKGELLLGGKSLLNEVLKAGSRKRKRLIFHRLRKTSDGVM
jgi:hypothetical protein